MPCPIYKRFCGLHQRVTSEPRYVMCYGHFIHDILHALIWACPVCLSVLLPTFVKACLSVSMLYITQADMPYMPQCGHALHVPVRARPTCPSAGMPYMPQCGHALHASVRACPRCLSAGMPYMPQCGHALHGK